MNYNGREHAVFAGSLFFYGWVFFRGRLIIAPTMQTVDFRWFFCGGGIGNAALRG